MRAVYALIGAALVALAATGPAAASAGAGVALPVRVVGAQDAAKASASVALTVDATASRHAISSAIYGVNFSAKLSGLGSVFTVPVDRWGGNSTSRYNYRNHTYNTGSDWYFENIVASGIDTVEGQVSADRKASAASLITLPMVGWVSKDSPSEHPFTCSFPKSVFGNQDSFDYWDPNCGNGTSGGSGLTADAATTSIAADAGYDAAMVSWLVGRYGKASSGGVKYYELDNEPTLWNSTHRDVHPAALGSAELWTKSRATAAAVKAADPSAKVLGPSDWGWCAYYYSAQQDCGQSVSADPHGGLPLGEWYLKQFAAADAASGKRTLDYFDEHFYPAANGVALAGAGSSATQALRLRSVRSLWDPTYVDESWIGTDVKAKPLQWIRTMKSWVAKYYPGTKTAITEYNFGGLESLNGALTQADVLGVFGREGLDLATLWPSEGTKASQPWARAFAMYRNYDGHGHTFGSTSVKAASTSQARLSVYAATRSSGKVLTVMVINKSGSKLTSTLSLKHFAAKKSVAVYRYSGAKLSGIVHQTSAAASGGKLKATYPAASITLLVLTRS